MRWNLSALAVFAATGLTMAQAPINVAPFGTATQTSDFGGGVFPASNALDGNYGNFTHTAAGDPAATWDDDLGLDFDIERIVVFNRGDGCCQERLRDITVSILTAGGASELFATDVLNPGNALGGPATLDIDVVAEAGAAVSGRIVRVLRTEDPNNPGTDDGDVLSMAEVEVYAKVVGPIKPVIQTPPVGGRTSVGESWTFTVDAVGTEPFTYKWKKDGGDTGVTTATLKLCPVKATDEGDYTVEVSNGGGSTESDPPATLIVTPRNLARHGEASQSTTDFGGDPSRAIDGNTSGNWGDGSLTHTSNQEGAWWEVALPSNATIDTVVLWNRTDCCPERLSNIRLSILTVDRTEAYSEDLFTDLSFPDTSIDGYEVPIPNIDGRIVRIERLGPDGTGLNYLSLAEVEVFGQAPEVVEPNLARRPCVVATQSSEYNGGQFPATNAIDGSTGNFTHTGAGQNLPATWEVNLQGDFDIESIVLWNRGDGCCQSRFRDITVSILDGASVPVWESELLNPENELGGMTTDGPPKLVLDLFALTGGFVHGHIVRVVRTPDPDLSGTGGAGNEAEPDVLSLGEVQVFEPVACPTQGDTHCLPFFFKVNGPADEGPGLYEVNGAAKDDSGDLVRYTFKADNGHGIVVTAGPQTDNKASLYLKPGTWDVSVTGDDSERCDDVAPDATCSKQVTVKNLTGDLAIEGVASQSSVGYGGVPDRAIDANRSGVYGDGSISHTNDGDPAPWWEVDLGRSVSIERIEIWNRTDCCSARLNDFRVSLLDAARSEKFSDDFFTEGDGTFPDTTTDPFVVETDCIEGQIVRIELLGDLLGAGLFLSLAEVEVYACTGPPPTKKFHRGDADDNGTLQLTDAIGVLGYLFLGAQTPGCLDALDADDNGAIQLTDAINILGFLFLGGPPPALPGPPPEACGPDTTPDQDGDLGCQTYQSC